jgi:ketosteroid isomerase-like protein
MKHFTSHVLFALTILIGSASFAQSPSPAESNQPVPASTASDTIDVQHVIDAYHEAVLAHDGSRLAHLFLPQSLWLNVLSDEAYARAKAKSPDAVKIRIGSYTDFAKLVSTSKASFNPTHTHLQENSDGTIASVYFDFVFLVDAKEQNRGSETWVLVKGTDGWRIAAITYSSNSHT